MIAGPESYVVAYRANTCPASPDDPGSITTAGLWTVPASGVQQVLLSAPASGRYCIAVWARDGVGRFSAKPATTFADTAGRSLAPRTHTRPPGKGGRVAGGGACWGCCGSTRLGRVRTDAFLGP